MEKKERRGRGAGSGGCCGTRANGSGRVREAPGRHVHGRARSAAVNTREAIDAAAGFEGAVFLGNSECIRVRGGATEYCNGTLLPAA